MLDILNLGIAKNEGLGLDAYAGEERKPCALY
jgi:hypothetical protein